MIIRKSSIRNALGGVVLALCAVAGGVSAQTIVVGGKGFTEQQLIAELTSQLLAANGFKPDKRVGMGTAVLRQGLESAQIDVCWEYTGTALSNVYKDTEKYTAEQGYDKIKSLDAAKGIVWLKPTRVNNSYGIGMLRAKSEKLGIKSISDLGNAYKGGKTMPIGVNAEFAGRPDGLPGVQKTYGFTVPLDSIVKMDFGLSFQALRDGQVESAMVTTTDGRIISFDILVLADDKNFFPFYLMTPVARKEVLDKNPKVGPLLESLSAKLDSNTILKLNAAVDVDKKSIESVASDFLKQQGLVKG
jgi:osmoprotectant transport system substrate-binding protein